MKRASWHLALVVLACVAKPALAQQTAPARSERPYRGLFGGGVDDPADLLSVTGSIGGGYDSNALLDPQLGSSNVPFGAPAQERPYGFLSAGADYTVNRTRASFQALGQTTGRLMDYAGSNWIGTYSGSVGGSFKMSRRDRLTGSYSITRQPYTYLAFAPALYETPLGIEGPPDQANGVTSDEYTSHTSMVEYARDITRRTSMELHGGYSRSNYVGPDARGSEYSTVNGGGRLRVGLTKDLGLRLGYTYIEADLVGVNAQPYENHNIDVGVDYSRALSFSRRTTLAFSTGSSLTRDSQNSYFNLIGSARVNREIGRTWNASLAYSRGLNFSEVLAQPVFSDSVVAGVGGFLNRRVQFTSNGGFSIGDVGLSSSKSKYSTYNANASLTTAITRHVGVVVDYLYYRYSFDDRRVLPLGYPGNVNRNDIRAYVTLWAPLFYHARRP
jgi:hypothetical protein